MKKYFILAMILIAGMTAYPQATRSARSNKSEKSTAKKETVQRSATRSASKAAPTKKATAVAPKRTQSAAKSVQPQKSKSTATRSTATRSTATRSDANRSAATRSGANRSSATKSSETRPAANRSASTRTDANRARVDTKSSDRSQNTRSSNEAVRRNDSQNKVQTKSGNGATVNRNVRDNRNDNRDVKVNTSSATRVYREGKGTLTRNDGTVVRHQNDEVFRSNKYKVNYDNYENLRRSDEFRRDYRDYDNWYHHRHVRVVNHYYHYSPLTIEIRRNRYYYRHPSHLDLIWTPLLFHRFMYYYPTHTSWEMEFGSQIETIPAIEAESYAGTVRRVYGMVDDVYYSPEDENYILYVGSPFPYQDLSIVIPRDVARRISMSPKWYFQNEYVWVVGLVNMWEGRPEIIVRDEDQIRKY